MPKTDFFKNELAKNLWWEYSIVTSSTSLSKFNCKLSLLTSLVAFFPLQNNFIVNKANFEPIKRMAHETATYNCKQTISLRHILLKSQSTFHHLLQCFKNFDPISRNLRPAALLIFHRYFPLLLWALALTHHLHLRQNFQNSKAWVI